MGVYNGITLESFPATLVKLCFAIILEGLKISITDAKVTITFPGGEPKVFDIANRPTVPKEQDLVINLFVAPAKILSEGIAELRIVFNGDNKTKFTHKFKFNKGVVNKP